MFRQSVSHIIRVLGVSALTQALRRRLRLARCGRFSVSTEERLSKSKRKSRQATPRVDFLLGITSVFYRFSVTFLKVETPKKS